MHCTEIAEKLDRLTLGKPQICRNLTVIPLIEPGSAIDAPLTLDEALGNGTAQVTEVSDGGHVPELRFLNKGDRPVLLLDGEELVGAKQNRVLNLTILAPANQEIVIPVSCVEQGRWSRRSHEFQSADRALYAKLRHRKIAQVSASLANRQGRQSDQGAIWDDIAQKSGRLESHSDTRAAAAMYERHDADLAEFVHTVQPVERQVGAVFVLNNSIAGVELFIAADLFRRLSSKLVRSYGIDAIDEEGSDVATHDIEPIEVAQFLGAVARAGAERYKALALGDDVRLDGAGVLGAALVANGSLIHLSAFARGFK